ncbi:MAG: glycosyltransferase family 4 protein [Bacteroidales bacterium]|nr:glycosyltransferase family 4 protein [Bacteroidales bacterium]
MKIGIWLNPDYSPEVGGGYSYYSRLIDGIDNYSFSDGIDICYIIEGDNTPRLNRPILQLSYTPVPLTIKEKIMRRIPLLRSRIRRIICQRDDQNRINVYTRILKSNNIKLIYYPIPCDCPLPNFPFVITHWDIGHRSTFAFPEVVGSDTFVDREHFYNTILPKALFVFCESTTGKEELIRFTEIHPMKIKVVPIFSGGSSAILVDRESQNNKLQQLGLTKNKYFYYPAQFWAHKNHITLLNAFNIFLKGHTDYKLVFTGSNQGNLHYIKEKTQHLELDEHVVFAGFVSQETVCTLYRNATAMVMPTLMGPTNMPLLEAMQVGCPVICSDFPGHREELAESAIYINPLNPTEICNAMEEVDMNYEKYNKLILSRIENCPFTLENALSALNNHLLEAIHLRKCWG